ncbi:MAG: radical SAM protein [Planctomycetes bacterium]|nr:radical SAM protein [Planctomycetota bacterium]
MGRRGFQLVVEERDRVAELASPGAEAVAQPARARELVPAAVLHTLQRAIGAMSGIVEVVTTCNLACTYCFAQRPSPARMSTDVASRIVEDLLRYSGRDVETKFIWHGGEPLLAGIPFYEHVLRTQRALARDGYCARNSLQTNGTLLTDRWIEFLRDNGFGVGSSVDGLREIHDSRRRDRNAQPTYDTVVGNVLRARERGLLIGVICVIQRDMIQEVERIYESFKGLGIPFTMSPVTPNHGPSAEMQPLTPEEYAEVLIRLFDVWFDDPDPTITVNPPHSVLQGILYGGLPLYCSADDSCFSKFVSFLPDGSVYPCNRFAGEPRFKLGNITREPLEVILQGEPRRALLARTKETLDPCSSCDSNKMCRGGCAHHAYAFHGDIYRPDYYCRAFFKAFSHYRGRLIGALRAASQEPRSTGETS